MAPKPTLAEEIRLGSGFASPAHEAFVSLAVTHDRLMRQATALLRTKGLSPAQYNVLRILRGAGEKGLACHDIRARLIHHLPDVTRLIDRLEGAGLARRGRDAADRRVVRVTITAKGLEALAALDEPTGELHERQFAPLEPRELETLIHLLDRVRPAAEA